MAQAEETAKKEAALEREDAAAKLAVPSGSSVGEVPEEARLRHATLERPKRPGSIRLPSRGSVKSKANSSSDLFASPPKAEGSSAGLFDGLDGFAESEPSAEEHAGSDNASPSFVDMVEAEAAPEEPEEKSEEALKAEKLAKIKRQGGMGMGMGMGMAAAAAGRSSLKKTNKSPPANAGADLASEAARAKKAKEEKAAEEKQVKEEKAAEEKRVTGEKAAKEKKAKDEKAAAAKRAKEEKAATDKAKKADKKGGLFGGLFSGSEKKTDEAGSSEAVSEETNSVTTGAKTRELQAKFDAALAEVKSLKNALSSATQLAAERSTLSLGFEEQLITAKTEVHKLTETIDELKEEVEDLKVDLASERKLRVAAEVALETRTAGPAAAVPPVAKKPPPVKPTIVAKPASPPKPNVVAPKPVASPPKPAVALKPPATARAAPAAEPAGELGAGSTEVDGVVVQMRQKKPSDFRRRNTVIGAPGTAGGTKRATWMGGAPAEKCLACEKTVYLVEKLEVDGKIFHKKCLKCSECSKILSAGSFASLQVRSALFPGVYMFLSRLALLCAHVTRTLLLLAQQGKIFCKPHFKQLFKLKGNYDEGFGSEQHKFKWDRSGGSEGGSEA